MSATGGFRCQVSGLKGLGSRSGFSVPPFRFASAGIFDRGKKSWVYVLTFNLCIVVMEDLEKGKKVGVKNLSIFPLPLLPSRQGRGINKDGGAKDRNLQRSQ